MTWRDDLDNRVKAQQNDQKERLVEAILENTEIEVGQYGKYKEVRFVLGYTESKSRNFIKNYIKENYPKKYDYISHKTYKYF